MKTVRACAAVWLALGFFLSTASAQTITTPPQAATQAIGGTAFFSVTATGSGTVTYQWQKNGVDITGAVNSTLILPNVQNSDAGNYSVNVTDSNGTVPSAPAALTVQAQVTLPSGLVAWWKLDETPGSPVAVDSVGNYNGVMSATGAAFVPGGRAGNALSLTSSANGLVNMGNVLNFVGQDFTVVAWIKTPVGDSGTFRNFLSKHNANFANGYILSYNHPTFPNAANKALFYAGTRTVSGGVVDVAIGTATVNDGGWHQLVGTYSASGNTSVYVDGAPVEGSIASSPIAANTVAFLLGGVNFGTTPTAMYSGLVDDVQIYTRALSDTRIDFLFQNPGQALPSSSALTILAPPQAATQAVGGTAFFSVTALSSNAVTYQWQKDGVDIAGAVKSTLIITNVQNSDAGNYSVNVTDSNGTVPSAPAALTVQAQVTLSNGLVAWWKLDETPGSPVAIDSVGNYNGVLFGGANFVAGGGRAGNAVNFDSTRNSFINMG